ncbi:MAG: NAD-dependent succinate-semialdehyde dehydrogenase [Candidatus Omnitrophica bacterium]|nr:NAD-dependent succinate-semialdehyde dehydrogenase [Candidatus Omnitrophota bacterium]
MAIVSINPATGQTIKSYPEISAKETGEIVAQANRAFGTWRRTGLTQRAATMKKAGELLRKGQESHARLMAQEMGKPLAQGRSEIEKCAWVCDYYAEHAEHFLAPEHIASDASKSFVTFEPLGIVLAVMPWNFPFWQVFRAAVPALMAGNAVLLKPASNVPGCALAIENCFQQTGLPQGLFRSVLMESAHVAELIEHPLVKAVTLTGSTPAGKAVAAKAGAMLKKTVLELGGSDPYIILEDADLEATAEACVASRLMNAGQSCIAAKRFIVVESVRKLFEALLVQKMQEHRMGDPLQEDTTVGPLARRDLRDALHEQVQRSIRKGARLLLGGHIPDSPGAYYPPTVLTEVVKGMPAYDEETFGPVAAISSVQDEAQAIQIANDSPFGLGAAIFTNNGPRGERIAIEQLEAGCCFVNAFVRSDPRLPFGGIKESGYGRELSSFGIREFVNIKTIYVK